MTMACWRTLPVRSPCSRSARTAGASCDRRHTPCQSRSVGTRRGVRICASSGEPSWMANPAIAQREVLRRYFVSSTTEEMLEIVSASSQVLDVYTSIDLLCHTADATLRGQLQGDPGELLEALYALLEGHIPTMKPPQLGGLLRGMSVVGSRGALADGLMERVAAQELASARVPSYNTRELCSIIHAYGRLARVRSAAVRGYVTALAAELARRMEGQPYVRSSMAAGDFTDLAAACAAIYRAPAPGGAAAGAAEPSGGGSGGGGSWDAEALPPAVAWLLDELASEVRHQLANKHSVRSPFTPRELVVLLGSYSLLGHHTAKVSGMLDAVAGFVVRRIKARHTNAVSRPEDMAGILQAYASLRHNSVVIPELLTAVGEQVCLNAAQQQERELGAVPITRPDNSSSTSSGGGSSSSSTGSGSSSSSSTPSPSSSPPGAGGAAPATGAAAAASARRPASADLTCAIPTLSDILQAHAEMGYAPSGLMLQALAPSICRQLPTTPAPQVLRLLELLAAVGSSPGPAALGLMLARLEDGGAGAGGASGDGDDGEALRLGRKLAAELAAATGGLQQQMQP